jgi:galactokinase
MRHIVVPGDWRFIVAHTGVRAEKSRHAREAYNQRRSECERALASVAERGLQSHLVPTAPQGYPDLLRMMGSQAAIATATEVLPAPLLSRFRHVVSEAARVDQAADCLSRTDFSGFGALMDDSHCSLRTDYEVSSGELDDLVDIARDGGAAGARLTGAGFGGCIVALASSDTVDAVLAAIAEQYYQPRGMSDRLGDCLFVAAPSAGASVDAL